MVEVLIAVAVIVAVVFFSKQIKGFAYSSRKKLEQRIPISAKIERTVKDLKRKREDYGFTLKDLYKSEEVVKQQIRTAKEYKKKEREEALKATLVKIENKSEECIKIIKKINESTEMLKNEQAYVQAMQSLGDINIEDIDLSINDLFAEIKAMEKMLENI